MNVAWLPVRRFGDECQRRGRRKRRHDEGNPEQPVVGEVLEDRAGKDDSQPAADSQDSGDECDRTGDALPRQLVADDPERQRKDRPTEALDRAGNDHQGEGGDDRRKQRARGQPGEGHDEHPLLAVHVAEPPRDRSHDGRREQVRREDPRHA